MLSKPKCGWTKIVINGKVLGEASHLTDVPQDTLNALIRYAEESTSPLCLEYDAEGYTFGMLKLSDSFYAFDTKDLEQSYINLQYLGSGIEFVKGLLKESVNDIESDFDEWIRWSPGDKSTEKLMENETNLKDILQNAKDILKQTE